ncbi:MAG: aquaporin, partial [Thermoanaerobaculia bacterium]
MRSIGARSLAESVGTLFLVATVVGSGIMGERQSGGNMAIALLANSLATGAGLVALILAFGPVSGAHFNPVVSLVEGWRGVLPWREAGVYVLAQIGGGLAGVAAANLMFGLAPFTESRHVRAGPAQWLAEAVATAGLLLVIQGAARLGTPAVAGAVGAYIASAYWFTSSTSFANPAVTLARTLTDSFSGIRPSDAPAFMAA